MKRIFFLTIVSVLFACVVAQAYTSGHSYINGKVTSVASDKLTIGDATYMIAPDCKVVISFKEQDSFHERPGRLSDIRRDDTVTAKKIANTLYEIMIERWR